MKPGTASSVRLLSSSRSCVFQLSWFCCFLLAEVSSNIIDTRWPLRTGSGANTAAVTNVSSLWTQFTWAVDGVGTTCEEVGNAVAAVPPNSSDALEWCLGYGHTLAADTVDISEDGSQCSLKRCGDASSLAFSDANGGFEVYTLLMKPFQQVTTLDTQMKSSCGSLLVDEVIGPSTEFVERCLALAAIHRGDVVDVYTSTGRCCVRYCANYSSLAFVDVDPDVDGSDEVVVYSNGVDAFLQLTLAEDGVMLDCSLLGEVPLTDTSDAVARCSAEAYLVGGDSFDLRSDQLECRVYACEEAESISFAESSDASYSSFSLLTTAYRPLTRFAENTSLDCTLLGTYEIPAGAAFPGACFSQGFILGADSFDLELGETSCTFRRCGLASDLLFSASTPAAGSYSTLVKEWVRLTTADVGTSSNCTSIAEVTIDPDEYPEACYSQALVNEGDTFDVNVDRNKCFIKVCGTFPRLESAFIEDSDPKETFSLLDPREVDEWGSCDSNIHCTDVTFLMTGKLKGQLAPVTSSGSACDPEDSDDCYGGQARRMAFYESKKRALQRRGQDVVLLDLGAMAFGGPFNGHPDYAFGMPATILSNMLPYDVCLLAAGDFLSKNSDITRKETANSFAKRICPLLLSNGALQGDWTEAEKKRQRYIVKELHDGHKIGFVGLFARIDGYGNSFGADVIDLDPSSRQAELETNSEDFRLNATAYKAALAASQYSASALQDYYYDIYRLATEVSLDALAAAYEMQTKYPDLTAIVLLCGSNDRMDQLSWLQTYGPFDLVLMARKSGDDSQVVSTTGKTVNLLSGYGDMGFSLARVRFERGKGMQKSEYEASIELDATVPSNETVQAALIDLYAYIKERNAKPYGTLTNPLTGVHRSGEVSLTKNQCYYTDCSGGDHMGRAFLWKAFDAGFEADLSYYNLGSFRAALVGDDTGTVSISHCVRTQQFQNTLKIFNVLGTDLYTSIKSLVATGEVGFMGAGFRIALHEPCFDYVDHTDYDGDYRDYAFSGTEEEIAACLAAGIDPDMILIDVQVYVRDESQCLDEDTPCENRKWATLEKGRTYTIVSCDYLAEKNVGWEDANIVLGTDAVVLCEYIAAAGTLEVESWTGYRDRGNKVYDTPEEGWASGNRAPFVKSSFSTIEAAATCPDGMYLPSQATSCRECPAGKVSVTDAARDQCDDCSAGFYAATSGLSACSPCKAGTYSGSEGAAECQVCDAGTYSDVAAIYCNDCKPGFYAPEEGSVECSACPVGSYSSSNRASSCDSCLEGFSTSTIASESASQCVCTEGTYTINLDSTTCYECPEGFYCSGGSYLEQWGNSSDGSYPILEAGYMSLRDNPWQAYRCASEFVCPGGDPGVCQEHRDQDSFACGRCLPGYYRASNNCILCDVFEYWPALVGLLCWVVMLFLLVFKSNTDLHSRSRALALCTLVAGIQMSTLQALGLFSHLSIDWSSPLGEFTRNMQFVSLDFGILRAECMIGNDPVLLFFLRHLSGPASVIVIAVLLLFKQRHMLVSMAAEFMNCVGTVFNIFYISLVTACVFPFFCYPHPAGIGSSMVTEPSILCFESGSWNTMVTIAAVSFVLVPLPFTVGVTYGTWKYPSLMANGSGDGGRTLMMYRFWWGRFRHPRYYYGLLQLIRSLAMAFVPVCVADDAVLQIGTLIIILLVFLTLQAHLKPWRIEGASNFDSGCSNALVVILVCGAASTDIDINSSSLTILGTGCIIAVVVAGCCGATAALHSLSLQRRPYNKFLCHHKAHAGAQARLIKILLHARGIERIFIDSDHLSDLDTLFDVVKFRVRHLVVYLTSHTLSRPWCVGEIFSAFVSGVDVLAVHTLSFVSPAISGVAEVQALLDERNCQLSEYKISYDDVVWGLQKLLSQETKAVHMSGDLIGKERFDHLTRLILKESTAKSKVTMEDPQEALVISVDLTDDEAAAACEILVHYISGPIAREVGWGITRLDDAIMTSDMQAVCVANGMGLLVMLSVKSLSTSSQLMAIAEGMLMKKEGAGEVVPIALPYLTFPSRDDYEKIVREADLDSIPELPNLMEALFKQIAVSYNTHASTEALKVQSLEVLRRVQSHRPNLHTATNSSNRLPTASASRGSGIAARITRMNSSTGSQTSSRLGADAVAAAERSMSSKNSGGRRKPEASQTSKRKSRLSCAIGTRGLLLDTEMVEVVPRSGGSLTSSFAGSPGASLELGQPELNASQDQECGIDHIVMDEGNFDLQQHVDRRLDFAVTCSTKVTAL